MENQPDPELVARLDRIEARQRAYGMHDPNCPRFSHDKLSKTPSFFGGSEALFAFTAPDCRCWLIRDLPVELDEFID